MLHFSTVELAAAFDFHSLAAGTSLALTLRGVLLDGSAFEAGDCVVVVGGGRGRGLEIDARKRTP